MYSFYAFLFRMKFIHRWGLMANLKTENAAEHSQQTALIAHALAVIDNIVFGANLNVDRIGMLAVFHETGEVLTGDLPTPIKYFSTEIAAAYKKVEAEAEKKLLSLLPTDLTKEFEAYVRPNKAGYEYKLVKCADKITAYIKCIEELKGQNKEFKSAHDSIKKDLNQMAKDVPCVKYFLDNFVDAFYKTLDELA